MKFASRISVLLLLAAGLSACGVRGSLEQPPEERSAAKEARDSGDDLSPREPARPFILDGLIR